jgi:bacterioferritin-associated ferredoxin
MYICLCNGVTESAIRRAAQAGIRTLGDLAMATGCTAGCGGCVDAAEAALKEALATPAKQPARLPSFLSVHACA